VLLSSAISCTAADLLIYKNENPKYYKLKDWCKDIARTLTHKLP
jgi:hypothetical protein